MGLPAPPLSLRSFKYATKREDRARGAGVGETQNMGEEDVWQGDGVEMGQKRGDRHREGWGWGQRLKEPSHSCPSAEAGAPEGTTAPTDVSLALEAPRAGKEHSSHPCISNLGCGTGGLLPAKPLGPIP